MPTNVSDAIERTLSVTLTIAAIAIALTLGHREFLGGAPRSGTVEVKPDYVKDWRDLIPAGNEMGSRNSRVKIIEFADFECPACRKVHPVLQRVRSRYGEDKVSMVFVHYPLKQHRFATLAARTAECAGAQNRFAAVHDLLFDKQDSLGLKSWNSYAREGGVADSAAFAVCVSNTLAVPAIDAGMSAGKRIQARYTPTVLVNGWRIPNPTEEELIRVVDLILEGKQPFPGEIRRT